MNNKRKTGSYYEDMAYNFLISQGLSCVERNFRLRTGEIDIIARDGDYLVFIEVKYKNSKLKGYSLEAVTKKKAEQIKKIAALYLYIKGYKEETNVRFDCIGIDKDKITWIKSAF